MSKTVPTPDPTPIDMDALPPAGGSYLRQPDGTLVPNPPAPQGDAAAAPAQTDTPATSE